MQKISDAGGWKVMTREVPDKQTICLADLYVFYVKIKISMSTGQLYSQIKYFLI